jgi:hypothetical protein
MVVRALNLNETSVQTPFTDVPLGSWYRDAISSAYAAGLVKGVTESGFAPDKEITREQMTVLIMRAGKYASEGGIKETGSEDSLSFADASSISDWAVKDIIAAVRAGIVNGRTANTFAPQDQATRAEAAVMMKRLLLD